MVLPLPSLGGLPVTVPEHEWQWARIDGYLIEDVRVVPMQGLSRRIGCGSVCPLPDRIEGTRRIDHRPSDGETPLCLDDERSTWRRGRWTRRVRSTAMDGRDQRNHEQT